MSAGDAGARDPDRRARRRLNLPPWWVLCRDVGLLLFGVTAFGGYMLSLLDEVGDNRTTEALADAAERDAYEAECRFDLAQPVERLEGEQFDVLVDAAIARGRQDFTAVAELVDRLEQIRDDKADAVAERADAVAECAQRADDVFGSGS